MDNRIEEALYGIVGTSDCHKVGIMGGCGVNCFVYQDGNCPVPEEIDDEEDTMTRGFRKLYDDAQLPTRATTKAGAYDFTARSFARVIPRWVDGTSEIVVDIVDIDDKQVYLHLGDQILVKTGITAYMLDDETLDLHARSGNGLKSGITITNGVGIVDADYEGKEIGFIITKVSNPDRSPFVIKIGDRIGQGKFQKSLQADEDTFTNLGKVRKDGYGSTNK